MDGGNNRPLATIISPISGIRFSELRANISIRFLVEPLVRSTVTLEPALIAHEADREALSTPKRSNQENRAVKGMVTQSAS
jgi:hypothetical protein